MVSLLQAGKYLQLLWDPNLKEAVGGSGENIENFFNPKLQLTSGDLSFVVAYCNSISENCLKVKKFAYTSMA
jgi:hypothetical protein